MGQVFLEAGQAEAAKEAFEHFDKIRPDAQLLELNLVRLIWQQESHKSARSVAEVFASRRRYGEGQRSK